MLMITGARGWEHSQWQDNYYPTEIPKDWHLRYYIKDFQTALAPVALWNEATIEEIEEFCSDVNEDYPLVFEQIGDNESCDLEKQQLVEKIAPNIIIFKEDGWQKIEQRFQIRQADIIKNTNLEKNCGVFHVNSTEPLKDTALTEILKIIKAEHKQYDVTYVYFDGELAAIDSLNTVITLRRHLVLD